MAKKENTSLGILDRANNNSIHLLYAPIDDESMENVCAWIIESNLAENPPDTLQLFINSHGGELHSVFAAIEMIKGSKIPVHTIAIGQMYSSGLLLFMAGEKGYRTLTPTCSIMSHDYATEVAGSHHEMMAMYEELNATHEKIMAHYKECTGLSDKVIKQKLISNRDNWLTPAQALQLGIADRIARI